LALGEAVQFRQRDVGPQVFLAARQFPKYLQRRCPPQIDAPPLAVGRSEDLGHSAWPVEVHVRVQVLPVELIDRLRVFRIDVTEPDVLADHRAVLGLHQTVVAAVMRARLGLLDTQFVQ